MTKLKVGAVIGESFKIWRGSLGDLLKNNWLLIIAGIAGIAVLGGMQLLPDTHGVDQDPAAAFLRLIVTQLFSSMFFGYVLLYVVKGENRAIGLGGLYINMPLIKMIMAMLFTMLIIWVVSMVFVSVGFIVMGATVGSMMIPGAMMGEMPAILAMDGTVRGFLIIAGMVLIIASVVFVLYLSARLMTLVPFCFLNNKIAISKPFAMTKGSVMRIWAIVLLSGLVMLAMILPIGLVGWGLFTVFPVLGNAPIFNLLAIVVASPFFALIWYFSYVVQAVMYKHLSSNLKQLTE